LSATNVCSSIPWNNITPLPQVVDQKFKNWYAIIHIKFGKQRKHIVIKNGDGKEKIPLVHDQNWQ
jgi:hypothetical protein